MGYTQKEINQKYKEIKQSLNTYNFVEQHLSEDTHLFNRHVEKTTAEHIDRVLDTNAEKPTLRSTSFSSDKDMFKFIKAAIREPINTRAIAEWLASDKKNELHIDFTPRKNQVTGRGIFVDPKTKKIAEFETTKMALRLAKNNSMPNGFAIVTAFPVLDYTAVPTNRDLSQDMHQTKAYQKANPIDKTLYDITCNPGFDTDTFSIGTAGPKNNHHTLYLSQLDPTNDAYTHRFSFNAKKCLFLTYKSMDYTKEAVKTEFISEKDKFNAISRHHNPQGMKQVYEQMPEFGALIEHGYQCFQKSMKVDPEYRKQNIKPKHKQMQDTTHPDTNPPNQKTADELADTKNKTNIPRSQRKDMFTDNVPTKPDTQHTGPEF